MIKGCLALGVIQLTRQFPSFTLENTEHHSLWLSSRIIPHNGHEGPHHQGTHPRHLFKCVMPLTSHVHDRGHGYSNSFNSADVYILTHTIRSPMPSKDMKCCNEAHILHQPS